MSWEHGGRLRAIASWPGWVIMKLASTWAALGCGAVSRTTVLNRAPHTSSARPESTGRPLPSRRPSTWTNEAGGDLARRQGLGHRQRAGVDLRLLGGQLGDEVLAVVLLEVQPEVDDRRGRWLDHADAAAGQLGIEQVRVVGEPGRVLVGVPAERQHRRRRREVARPRTRWRPGRRPGRRTPGRPARRTSPRLPVLLDHAARPGR